MTCRRRSRTSASRRRVASSSCATCRARGWWNADDGFVLTDPVVHYVSSREPLKKHKNGATDKGRDGVAKFFATHKCNALCERLGLKRPEDMAATERMAMPCRP